MPGLKGFKSIWKLTEILNNNFAKSDSGIHYTIDIGADKYSDFKELVNSNPDIKEWILKELDTWNYKGTYNSRKYNWFKLKNNFKAIEFRIGEMTFDYSLICKRIAHCQYIVKNIKAISQNYELFSFKKLLDTNKELYLSGTELIKIE